MSKKKTKQTKTRKKKRKKKEGRKKGMSRTRTRLLRLIATFPDYYITKAAITSSRRKVFFI